MCILPSLTCGCMFPKLSKLRRRFLSVLSQWAGRLPLPSAGARDEVSFQDDLIDNSYRSIRLAMIRAPVHHSFSVTSFRRHSLSFNSAANKHTLISPARLVRRASKITEPLSRCSHQGSCSHRITYTVFDSSILFLTFRGVSTLLKSFRSLIASTLWLETFVDCSHRGICSA